MSLRKNTLWNLVGNGLPLLAGAIAVPYLMSKLGTEKFGIVTLLWTLIGYLSLFDFGLGRALTQLIANNLSTDNNKENLELLKTAVYLTAIAGIIGGLSILFISYPLAYSWLNISSINQLETYYAIIITSCAVPVTTISASFRGALEGLERFKQANIVRVFFGTATFLFPILAILLFKATIINIAISLVLARIITLILYKNYIQIYYNNYKLSFKPNAAHKKKLISFGSWMTLSNVISPILVSSDRFIISGILGAELVAFYTIPFEIIMRLQIIPGAIGASIFPRLSACFGRNDSEAYRITRKCLTMTTIVMIFFCTILIALYVPIVSVWINKSFAETSFFIASFLAVGSFVNAIAFVFYTAVQAKNGSRATGILHLSELIIYIPILLFFVSLYGIRGAAVAWTTRVSIDCFFLYLLYLRGKNNHV